MNLDELFRLYNKYLSLPKFEKNIFEIMGYPYYENIISNVLAFYFNPKEEHKLNMLFLYSLMQCLGEDIDKFSIDNFCSIYKEYFTEKGNRIDLIIEFEETVIVIENKIYADLYNDLDDYYETICRDFPDKKNKIFVVLSVENVSKSISNKWKNIIYRKFVESIEKNLGSYYQNSDAKYLIYLKDFIMNMNNIIGGNRMDEKIKFYFENQKIINELCKLANEEIPKFINNQFKNLVNMMNGDKFMGFDDWALDAGRIDRKYKFIKPKKYKAILFFDFWIEDLLKTDHRKLYIQLSGSPDKIDKNKIEELNKKVKENNSEFLNQLEAKGIHKRNDFLMFI